MASECAEPGVCVALEGALPNHHGQRTRRLNKLRKQKKTFLFHILFHVWALSSLALAQTASTSVHPRLLFCKGSTEPAPAFVMSLPKTRRDSVARRKDGPARSITKARQQQKLLSKDRRCRCKEQLKQNNFLGMAEGGKQYLLHRMLGQGSFGTGALSLQNYPTQFVFAVFVRHPRGRRPLEI